MWETTIYKVIHKTMTSVICWGAALWVAFLSLDYLGFWISYSERISLLNKKTKALKRSVFSSSIFSDPGKNPIRESKWGALCFMSCGGTEAHSGVRGRERHLPPRPHPESKEQVFLEGWGNISSSPWNQAPSRTSRAQPEWMWASMINYQRRHVEKPNKSRGYF